MWLLAVANTWGAEPVGFWYGDDLAAISKLYASSSEQLQAGYGEREQFLERSAAAIREYRVALDLLGDRAPAAERARLEALEEAHARNYSAMQAFAETLVADYDEAFTAAVEGAAAARGTVVQCQGRIAVASSGPRIPGAQQKTMPNPECKGEDLNAALAASVDADPMANQRIGAIVGRAWPAPGPLPVAPQAMVGTGERWIRVADLFKAGARSALTAIDRADDDARDEVEAAMESARSQAEVDRLVPKVKEIEATTAAARAALAGPVLAVAEARMAKWKGEPATAWCANPAALGGCKGTDGGTELLSKILADKKVAASLP